MNSEFIKFILPVLATIISPIIIFLISRAANKENNKMLAINARADFLSKLIHLQERYEDLGESSVKLIIKRELDSFFEVTIPVLQEKSEESDLKARAIREFHKIPPVFRFILFYRQASISGHVLRILYYLFWVLFVGFMFTAKLTAESNEKIGIYLIVLMVTGYLVGSAAVVYTLYYLSKKAWISSYGKSKGMEINQSLSAPEQCNNSI